MPSAADFRRAFELEAGAHLGDKKQFEIESSRLGHEIKQQNERYEFPTALIVRWRADAAAAHGRRLDQHKQLLADGFKRQTRSKRIVYSAYGSPYECIYGLPKVTPLDEEGRSFELTAVGRAVRRRDFPTLVQEKAAEREAAGGKEKAVSPEDKARYLEGYRVVKSRFGTSKCDICQETVEPGTRIAKEESEKAKGRWSHEGCVVRKRKAAAGGISEQEASQEEEEAAAGHGFAAVRRKQQRSRGGSKAGSVTAGVWTRGRQRRASSEE